MKGGWIRGQGRGRERERGRYAQQADSDGDEEEQQQRQEGKKAVPALRRVRTSTPQVGEASSGRAKGTSSREQPKKASNQNQEQAQAAHQQAVLQSLATYLEGELMVRLKAFAELTAEVESVSNERLFYRDKLRQIEKVCEKAQPLGSAVPLVESVLAILRTTADQPHISTRDGSNGR